MRELLRNPHQRITRNLGPFACTPYDLLKCTQVLHSSLPERRAAGQNGRTWPKSATLDKTAKIFPTGDVLSTDLAPLGTIKTLRCELLV